MTYPDVDADDDTPRPGIKQFENILLDWLTFGEGDYKEKLNMVVKVVFEDAGYGEGPMEQELVQPLLDLAMKSAEDGRRPGTGHRAHMHFPEHLYSRKQ